MRNFNYVSQILVFSLVIIVSILYFDRTPVKEADWVELRSTYKGCIIVYKQINNGRYKISLYNPVKHKYSTIPKIDYNVYVKDYVYWNIYFIGDTIK